MNQTVLDEPGRRAVPRWLAPAVVAVALLAVGCGTTVPLTSSTQVGGGNGALGAGLDGESPFGDGASGGGSGGSAGSGTTGSSGGSASTGSSSTGSSGATTGNPGSASSTTTGMRWTPSRGGAARGVTDRTILLGIAIATGTEALEDSFGIQGAGTVSPEEMAKAVVADVNSKGGVLGRKVELYVHRFDAASAIANPEQTVGQICADFRDDHKVFALVFDVPLPSLRACLADMGSPVLVLNGVGAIMPASAYASRGGGWVYGPTALTSDRLAELFVDSLLDRSFTETWNTTTGGRGAEPTKLGVIHVDTPDQNALYASYERELRKHGLRFADKVTYTQDASAALAATQNAVLKFRSNGITHVFGASAFFLRAAENQGYRPRYAYLPGLGALGVANVPAAQMRGAQSVGWAPTLDVNDTEDPGPTAGAAACLAVMKRARLSTTERRDQSAMHATCDVFQSFRDAMRLGGSADLAGLRRGYEALGTGFRPALTFRTSLGPGRHAGVDSVRDLAFDSECGCLRYASARDRS